MFTPQEFYLLTYVDYEDLLADGARFALYAYDRHRGEYREVDT